MFVRQLSLVALTRYQNCGVLHLVSPLAILESLPSSYPTAKVWSEERQWKIEGPLCYFRLGPPKLI